MGGIKKPGRKRMDIVYLPIFILYNSSWQQKSITNRGVASRARDLMVIASVLYFPMLIFSGATFPYEVMPATMQKIVNVM